MSVACEASRQVHCGICRDEIKRKKGAKRSFFERYISNELSSRSVARQVFSPQQSLTSVFGMGTGGPSAVESLIVKITKLSFFDISNKVNG